MQWQICIQLSKLCMGPIRGFWLLLSRHGVFYKGRHLLRKTHVLICSVILLCTTHILWHALYGFRYNHCEQSATAFCLEGKLGSIVSFSSVTPNKRHLTIFMMRLQARAHLHAPGELALGLHLVNSTNLDYFQPQHQAELFRLKGQFLQALGERDQANSNYSTALTIWDQLPAGWLSWGSHCDEMYESSGNHAWLEYTVSCYLQAVKHGSCAGRIMLPRVLHLLSFENDTGAVGRALDRKLNGVGQPVEPVK